MAEMDRNDSLLPHISLSRSAWRWWRDIAYRDGQVAAAWQLLVALWEFARDSTPERRRQRYGDAGFDWDYRVDTTSAALGWRNRLLGTFHSTYQPTEADLFHQMLEAVQGVSSINLQDFTFIDVGSGKGRTLLMASDYPFRRIVGVELLPALHHSAQENIRKYRSVSQKCFALEAMCADATQFVLPVEPTLLYLFNPLPESGLIRLIANLNQSLRERRRKVYVLYHNPLLEHVLSRSSALHKIGGTHQYVLYASE
jgi:hypothetical protein